MDLNTFDKVAQCYAATKPVVSKNHTRAADVRPISDRTRKWERIKKISDTMYALCDGNYGNCIWGQSLDSAASQYEDVMAAILWIRRDDGDFIRIRNHNVNHTGVSRYEFLRWYLPTGLNFEYDNGKHWVNARTSNDTNNCYTQYMLPKTKTSFDWGTKRITVIDDVYLMFRVNGDGTFTRVGDPLPVQTTRVDKDRKKELKPMLEEFYMFCAAVAPMLDLTWQGRAEYNDQINAEMIARGLGRRWLGRTTHIPHELILEVMKDDQHPLRVAVAAFVVNDIGGKRTIEDKEDLRSVKSSYNRLMNRALVLYKTEEI